MELQPAAWAEEQFGRAALGDTRRTRRVVTTACAMVANPQAALPEQLPDWADLMAAYRVLDAAEVSHAALLGPHWDQTRAAARMALALEDLSGIRERTTVRRVHRYERHSWAFFQLRQYITYKAAWAGIPVYLVDPRNTSRICPRCGYCSKDNRKSQAIFACTNPTRHCGFTGHADHIGAINVAARAEAHWAAVNQPMASSREG
jgi:IS605 OrfB family transposase